MPAADGDCARCDSRREWLRLAPVVIAVRVVVVVGLLSSLVAAPALAGSNLYARAPRATRRKRMAKYGKKAQDKVEKAMHERKRGTLKSGKSGKKVTSRKQAIAIGLSEARKAGAKVPKQRSSKARKSKSS